MCTMFKQSALSLLLVLWKTGCDYISKYSSASHILNKFIFAYEQCINNALVKTVVRRMFHDSTQTSIINNLSNKLYIYIYFFFI